MDFFEHKINPSKRSRKVQEALAAKRAEFPNLGTPETDTDPGGRRVGRLSIA